MKKLLTLFILASSLSHATIIPIDNSFNLVEDELFPYQWGLLNQGQTFIREKDDTHNIILKGIPGKDLGWKSLVGRFSQRRPIVAVLDSGVDLTHPELQGNLWRNEKECGKDPKVDNDGNKLAGDCNGWNFTEAMDSDAAKNPSDIDGHGTHIAGIIAALNNGEGIVGVVPNALIMPVKVMRDSTSTSTIPSADAFALGIIYAVDNGADVINMSLGWPRALETKALRDAVYYALGQGVPIVAAAGNNNSSEPLYPCAYDGVICVGATSPDGRFAPFSNFGGHVDTLAPGEGILGLNPILFEPELSSFPGFEFRSGTSQSAPFVSGMIAAFKAHNKDITIDQLFARLYQFEKIKDESKYILGGVATWDALNSDVTSSVLRPIFKKLRQIIFKADSLETTFPISVRNFGLPASHISVKVESLSKGVEIDSDIQTIPSLAEGEFKDLQFRAEIKDLNSESNISIKMTIEANGKSESYINQFPIVRDLRSDPKYKKVSFAFTDKPLPVGTIREGMLLPLISKISSYGKSLKHEFFMKRTLKDEKKIELTLFTKKGNQYIQNPSFIFIDDAVALVNFVRVDLNLDGKEDYFVQSLVEKDGKRYFVFSFYNEELKPLWPSFQNAELKLDLYVENLNDVSFMKHEDAKLGKILVPAFFTVGMLPKIDQEINSWKKPDLTRKNRLYYLEPNEKDFRVRTVTTNVWEKALKDELRSNHAATVETEQLLPPSEDDTSSGKLRVLVSVGVKTQRQILIHTFDTKTKTHGKALPQLVIQSDSVDPLLNVSDNGLTNDGDVYFNIYDNVRAKAISTRGEDHLSEYVIRRDFGTDLIAGHIASFESQNKRLTVYQTREELISVTTGAQTKQSSRPKLRYSFLSQKLLSEMYFPVSYRRNSVSSPALYVDATAVTANRVYLFEDQNGELVSSIRNSIIIPAGCRSMTPSFNAEAKSFEFIFLCLEDKDYVIRTYEMN